MEGLLYTLPWISGVKGEASVRCQKRGQAGEYGRNGFNCDWNAISRYLYLYTKRFPRKPLEDLLLEGICPLGGRPSIKVLGRSSLLACIHIGGFNHSSNSSLLHSTFNTYITRSTLEPAHRQNLYPLRFKTSFPSTTGLKHPNCFFSTAKSALACYKCFESPPKFHRWIPFGGGAHSSNRMR